MSPLVEAVAHAFTFGQAKQDFQPLISLAHDACGA